jgi:VWFA-related protein
LPKMSLQRGRSHGATNRVLGHPVLPLFALLAIAQHAGAQTSPAPANNAASTPQQTAAASTLQSNVTEVSLDLVVRDKKNRLVPDLTAADLTVTDNGSPVKLSNLHLAGGTQASSVLVALVFDHLDPAQSKNARAIAAKLLKTIPDQNLRFAVLRTDGRLRLLQQYTTDRGLIDHAIGLATEGSPAELTADSAEAEKILLTQAALPGATVASGSPVTVSAADREAARMTYAALTASQQMTANQQTPQQLAALMAIAQAERTYLGRKVMIYFTAGIDADSRTTEMIKTAAGEANRAGVSLYAIDMSAIRMDANEDLSVTAAMGAVMTSNHFNPIAAAPTQANPNPGVVTPGMRGQIAENMDNLEMNDFHAAAAPIGRLAEATGGRYIPAEVNMNKSIHLLVQDLTTYYVASYTPPINEYDGSFRAIAVKPLRKDISIRARSGYFALPPSDISGLRPFEMPLVNILKQPQPPTDFSFASRIVELGSLPSGLTQEVVIETPISELEIKKDTNSGLYSVHANLLAQIVDGSGTVVEQFGQELRRHGALDTLDAARGEVLSFQRAFVAAPGSYTLKVAVFDAFSGKAAVAQTAFQLAPSQATSPSLSDIFVVRRLDPVTPSLDKDAGLGDPLRSSTGEVVPNLAGTIQAGAKDVSLFFIIHPGPDSLGKPAMEITVSRDGHPIGRAPLTFRESADGGPVSYFSTVGTRSMSAGEYVATVRFTQGEQTVERSVSMKIEGNAKSSLAHVELAAAKPAPAAAALATASEITEAREAASAALPPLDVTPAGPNATTKSVAEIDSTLDEARQRALAYANNLPNFLCVETTNRSLDSAGKGNWKHQDSFSQLLTYRNHTESRKMIEVDGHETHTAPDDLKGMVSNGEFGGILNAIFEPAAKATFVWKENGLLSGEKVDLFEYHVAARDSSFGLTGDNNWQYKAAFHGVVSIDSATMGVRQLTIIADDLPPDFSIHASAIRVDYDYIAINGHDYLLPTRATISLRRHKHEGVLNEIKFRDYRRFGAKSRMVPVGQ